MEIKQANQKILIGCGIAILLIAFLGIGFVAGRISSGPLINIPATNTSQSTDTGTVTNTEALFKPFWEAWQIVHTEYLVQPVNDEQMMQGAIRGMMDSLGDLHTGYMSPSEFVDANAELSGYSGIGAYVNLDGDYLTITEPIKGSPAEAAGLKPGDKILKVNGEEMTGVLPELVRQKVLGPAGTQVTLTIVREGVDQPFDVTITRAQINIPSTEYKMLDNQIAYVRLNAFSDTSGDDLHAALQDLMAQNPKGLILDLRNNSGGYLTAAIQVASEFLPDGVAAYEEFRAGDKQTFDVTGKGIATQIPMVVLVNEYSASASELVAGALQDRGRAQLVGAVTYGKGTVQNWIPLSSNEGAVRVTIARWLTPDGRNVTGTGLTPDVEVAISDADAAASIDTQLNRAVEVLSQP